MNRISHKCIISVLNTLYALNKGCREVIDKEEKFMLCILQIIGICAFWL